MKKAFLMLKTKFAQCKSCKLNFIWSKMRTSAWEREAVF